MNDPTLVVRDLATHFTLRNGVVRAVDNVSFSVDRGKILGLVGESGSGKSVTGFSILGLIDPPGHIAGDRDRAGACGCEPCRSAAPVARCIGDGGHSEPG